MILNSKNDKISCYALLVVVILYYSQEALFSSVEILSILMLTIISSISSYYLVKMLFLRKKFTRFMKNWLLFLIMYFVYWVLFANYEQYHIIKAVLLNFLPFFPFYYFAEKGILTEKVLKVFFLFMFPIIALRFLLSLSTLRYETMQEDVVENSSYYFIGLLPFVFLFRNKIVSVTFLMIMWYLMIQSAKRAAIICGATTFLLLVFDFLHQSEGKAKARRYFIAGLLFLVVGYFAYDLYEQNQYLIERMDSMKEGQSSGRDFLIEHLLKLWYESDNAFRYIFGFGYNASGRNSPHVSHNDWVDMLVSFGLVGFVVYFNLYRLMFLDIVKKKWIGNKKNIMVLVFLIAIITSLTSRWYWSTFIYMQILILPYLLATHDREV